MLGVELGNWHSGISFVGVICSHVFRPHLQLTCLTIGRVGKTVDFETEVRQYLVVDNIVQKNGIRVEGFLRQNDAIIK